MKYLLTVVILVLIGCSPQTDYDSADKLGLYLGTKVRVVRGFYKNCTGIVTEYTDFKFSPDTIGISNVNCGTNISVNYITVDAKDVKVIQKVK